eukprot:6491049-Amphidinium_carterae.2
MEWGERVVCSDAAPGGQGLAWSYWPPHLVRDACRVADARGARTFHAVPGGLLPDGEGRLPLKKVQLPLSGFRWYTAGVSGGFRHIGLEEAHAACWGLESRLRYPRECRLRVLHPTDSSTVAGAFSKGRSSSFLLNQYCRRSASIQLSYALYPFFPWISTKVNPADEPSRRFCTSSFAKPDYPSSFLPSVIEQPCEVSPHTHLFEPLLNC